jgi:hypothetical protein
VKSYLFLDVDGVLNNRKTPAQGGLFGMDLRNVAVLNEIVQDVRPEIVVSSTWRWNHDTDEMRTILLGKGFDYPELVVGATSCIYGSMVPSIQLPENQIRRGVEIVHWLEIYAQPPCGLAILDDETDMWVLRDRLVKTGFNSGLTAEHVEPAVRLLQTPLTELPDSAVARLVHDPFTGTGGPRAVHIHRGER